MNEMVPVIVAVIVAALALFAARPKRITSANPTARRVPRLMTTSEQFYCDISVNLSVMAVAGASEVLTRE